MENRATEIPVEAIADYFENHARLMIKGGIPLERVAEALRTTATNVSSSSPDLVRRAEREKVAGQVATRAPTAGGAPVESSERPMKGAVAGTSRLAEVLAKLQPQARPARPVDHAPEDVRFAGALSVDLTDAAPAGLGPSKTLATKLTSP